MFIPFLSLPYSHYTFNSSVFLEVQFKLFNPIPHVFLFPIRIPLVIIEVSNGANYQTTNCQHTSEQTGVKAYDASPTDFSDATTLLNPYEEIKERVYKVMSSTIQTRRERSSVESS